MNLTHALALALAAHADTPDVPLADLAVTYGCPLADLAAAVEDKITIRLDVRDINHSLVTLGLPQYRLWVNQVEPLERWLTYDEVCKYLDVRPMLAIIVKNKAGDVVVNRPGAKGSSTKVK